MGRPDSGPTMNPTPSRGRHTLWGGGALMHHTGTLNPPPRSDSIGGHSCSP